MEYAFERGYKGIVHLDTGITGQSPHEQKIPNEVELAFLEYKEREKRINRRVRAWKAARRVFFPCFKKVDPLNFNYREYIEKERNMNRPFYVNDCRYVKAIYLKFRRLLRDHSVVDFFA